MSDVTIRTQVGSYVPPNELGEIAGAIRGIDPTVTVDVEAPRATDQPHSALTEQVIEVVLNEGTQLMVGAVFGAIASGVRARLSKRKAAGDEKIHVLDGDGHLLAEVAVPADRVPEPASSHATVACRRCGYPNEDAVRCRKCGDLLP